ncbi:MAG: beta-propeller fold lactonase family protein [Blastocatellia bacterium]
MGTNTAPAQILFSEDGDLLVVSEKATNKLTAFHIDRFGYAFDPKICQSAGATPFGPAFGRNHQLFVAEANGGIANASSVSSYVLDEEQNEIMPISRSRFCTGQTAACWIVLTPDNRFAFVSNTDSNSISSYRISFSGGLTLSQSRAATTAAGPIDMTMSSDGRYLYALNRAGGSISQYQVGSDGRLTPMRNRLPALPTSANGLAAR